MTVDFNSYFRAKLPAKASGFGKALGIHLGFRSAIDATCGLAQDATFMVRLGFEVFAFERNSQVFELLQSSFVAALPTHAELMKLHLYDRDAAQLLRFGSGANSELASLIPQKVDIIYLDPMFHLPKRTSLPRKEIQMLTEIVGHDDDQLELFESARSYNPRRIVLKRKLKAPRGQYPLPDHSFRGQKIRYDIYLGKPAALGIS